MKIKVQNLLIILSSLSFVCTIIFKNKAESNFYKLNSELANLYVIGNDIKKSEMNVYEEEYINQFCTNLSDVFYQFTYFDENIDGQLKNIIFLIKEHKDVELKSALYDFQDAIYIRQHKLSFSFDCLLYSSLFLIFIAIAVIIYQILLQKNELTKLQTINDQQLRFSRDLHDGVAQDLAALKLYLEKKDEEKSIFYAEHALSEVRFIIDSMHIDLSKNYEEILKETLSNFEINYNIKTELLIACSKLESYNIEFLIELLRVLQEALSNIARHSAATKVTVNITEVGNDLNFFIKDNGKGFNIEEISKKFDSSKKKHYGIKNIQDRVHGLGGTVDFINAEGTVIAICFKDIIR